ncbi:unnamed protein product [Darwinula stevensoni]|uniref:Uncharacterized protein n=1 Tax=Darwinula stevensoni TaxID=69355 RepID=A0A7R9ABI2_9CRUS|nr:unnamed protein product [Darwinula stevensoni]CAG0899464.1 unnamed protein product [Darwinula stevensoni]
MEKEDLHATFFGSITSLSSNNLRDGDFLNRTSSTILTIPSPMKSITVREDVLDRVPTTTQLDVNWNDTADTAILAPSPEATVLGGSLGTTGKQYMKTGRENWMILLTLRLCEKVLMTSHFKKYGQMYASFADDATSLAKRPHSTPMKNPKLRTRTYRLRCCLGRMRRQESHLPKQPRRKPKLEFARAWLMNFLTLHGQHSPCPTKKIHVQGFTIKQLYRHMQESCVAKGCLKENLLKYVRFTSLVKDMNISIAKPNAFLSCGTWRAVTGEARRDLEGLRERHLKMAEFQRSNYTHHKVLTLENGDWVAMVVDGMDQKKTNLPRFVQEDKHTNSLPKLVTHIEDLMTCLQEIKRGRPENLHAEELNVVHNFKTVIQDHFPRHFRGQTKPHSFRFRKSKGITQMHIRLHAGEAWCPNEHDIQYIRECLGPDLGYVCLQTTPVLNACGVLVPPDWNAAGLEVVRASIQNYFLEMSEDKVHAWHVFSPDTQQSMEPVLYLLKLRDYNNTSTEQPAGITPTMQSYLANIKSQMLGPLQEPIIVSIGSQRLGICAGTSDLHPGMLAVVYAEEKTVSRPFGKVLKSGRKMAAGSYEADRPMDEDWAPLILQFCAKAGLEVVRASIQNYFPEMSEDKVHAWHVFSPDTQQSMEPVLYLLKLRVYKNTSTEQPAGITPTMQSYLANMKSQMLGPLQQRLQALWKSAEVGKEEGGGILRSRSSNG